MKIIIVSAPSGAGKTTIVRRLLESVPYLAFSISATTRPQRGKEVNGIDYYFLSNEEFDNNIASNDFIEWEEVYPGRKYGTLKIELERIINNQQFPIFDVDVKGGLKLKSIFKENALALFVKPPSIEILRQRLNNRGVDSQEDIEIRLQKAIEEMSYSEQFDYTITNESLELAASQVEGLALQFLGK